MSIRFATIDSNHQDARKRDRKCDGGSKVWSTISAKEPYISAKEPYISGKEPYISTKEAETAETKRFFGQDLRG